MECVMYTSSIQESLDKFFSAMFMATGFKYEPHGKHVQLRNIDEVFVRDGGSFWILLDGTKVVGTGALKVLDKENGIGEVRCMFVLPDYQGNGYGKLLLTRVVVSAREKGIKVLRLSAKKEAERAIGLYRKMGFYDIPRYSENPIAQVFMEMRLDK
ncbi:MAG: GNAT family N-acetyltransferase [Clostridia bacterium]|nr:GNAT family N-acetyltransferase [Clostridia bacterium]